MHSALKRRVHSILCINTFLDIYSRGLYFACAKVKLSTVYSRKLVFMCINTMQSVKKSSASIYVHKSTAIGVLHRMHRFFST